MLKTFLLLSASAAISFAGQASASQASTPKPAPAPKSAAAAKPPAPPADPGWPRRYTDGTAELVVYQPQVDRWTEFKSLQARLAVALTPKKGAKPVYGAVEMEAETLLDSETNTVLVGAVKLLNVSFPSAKDETEAKAYRELAEKLAPKQGVRVSLDRILAYMDLLTLKPKEASVSMEPPPIFVANQDAVLMIIDGEPIPVDIEKTGLQKVVNTNWDLIIDKDSGKHYLRFNQSWLTAKSLTDAWSVVKKLPGEFQKLPDTEQYKELKQSAAAPQPLATVPLVLVSKKPAELVLIKGEPRYESVAGTHLMWVSNTESDLFFDQTGRAYYLLTSGRWFRTADLKSSKWESATTSMPKDFSKVPADHPRAHVRAAIPGTKEAEEAVLEASVPVVATVDRKTAAATAKVDYVGEPQFKPIEGTSISYAENTPSDVLKVGEKFYLCMDGVWFVSATAKGPWEMADTVPQELYSIPPSSPKHNVTYVQVYESTPTTVTYGYTAGYTGVMISYGVVMWGTGYYYPPYYHYGMYPYYWRPPYYTYGASAWYNPATGMYARGASVYGPYGGYGRAAAYNPRTGTYAWGQAAYGPYGAAASGGFYNPRTGAWGGSYRATNGYQSWGQSVVGKGDQWARTAHYADSRGAVGVAKGSEGGKAIAAAGEGGRGFAAKTGSGDIYAGKNGNVYKREDGQWYSNSGSGSWDSVDRPTGTQAQQERAAQAREGVQQRPGGSSAQTTESLNRDAAARQRGNYNAGQSSTRGSGSYSGRSSGSYSGRSSGGYSSRGGGGGYRGGGRRR